jgi:aryl-alcohol dehydrogenase-like predicted oxidoreductase
MLKLKPKMQKLKSRFGSNTEDLASVALNYVLSQPHVCCVIPGFRNERQARCNIAGAGRSLSPEDVQFVRESLA